MTRLERLRLAVALVHTAPGGELRLRTAGGAELLVSERPTADIDPCGMRRVVAACSCPHGPDHSRLITDIEIGGSLQHLGGGVRRLARGGEEQRWIATFLPPERVVELLDDVEPAGTPADAVRADVRTDRDLGVSVLVVRTDELRHLAHLDEIAARAAAAVFTDELVRSTT